MSQQLCGGEGTVRERAPPPLQQAEEIQAAMNAAKMEKGTVWYVVCAKWWESWKEYTKFDQAEEKCVEELSLEEGANADLGPVDNTSLVGERQDVLSRNLTEDEDYVLLPAKAYEHLIAWYGGTVHFQRKVIQLGEGAAAVCSVELYPFQFKVYKSNADGEPDLSTEELMLFGRTLEVSVVKQQLCERFELQPSTVRPWVKIEDDQNSMSDIDDSSTNWNMLQNDHMEKTLEQLLVNVETKVQLLLEVKQASGFKRSMSPAPEVLPEDWKERLKVGDVVDAMDTDKRWFESIILEMKGQQVKVHFKGWSSKWDSYIDINSDGIQPLHTKTPKWRNFQVDQELEVRTIQGESQPRWYEGKVLQVDRQSKKILVQTAAEKMPNKWVDMNGEDVCNIGTHIKKKNQTLSSKRNASGVVTRPGSSMSSSPTRSYGWYGKANTSGKPPVRGAVGLSNLGNTCFMNSMLQCLSNTPVITQYFLEERHSRELNEDNPLGAGGKIARSYASLLSDMWSGNYTVVVPTDFKRIIGQFAPQFAGYQQQDSQELMSFLLDGLHEDLNRIRQKPYVETVESKGRPDEVVAQEAWGRYLQRNDSVIVDHCQGQLKSHVICPTCGYESITFDPFLSLSLPLPVKNAHSREVSALFFKLPYGSKPYKVTITVPTNSVITAMKEWVAQHFDNVQADKIQVCDVWSHRAFRTLHPSSPITEVRTNDIIIMYQTEASVPARPSSASGYSRYGNSSSAGKSEPNTGVYQLDILMGRRTRASSSYYASKQKQPIRFELYGMPFILSYTRETTNREIYRIVSEILSRFLDANKVASKMEVEDGKETEHKHPFTLHTTNNMGSNSDGELPYDNETFSIPSLKALTVEIPEEVYEQAVDEQEMKAFEVHSSVTEAKAAQMTETKGIRIEECFNKFVEREQLGENDPWYCSSCKNHQRAYKKFDLWSTPDILILHLKRFLYLPGSYFVHRQKIDDLVQFPVEGLDLSQFILGPKPQEAPPVYDLYAVSEHSGGLGGGHYTAVGKNFEDSKWYNFNDSSVHETDARSAVTSRAYVLFYRRRQGNLRWAGMTNSR